MTDRAAAAAAFYGPLAASPSATRRVGWDSEEAHRLRLSALAEAVEPLAERASLLDAGCGEGALLAVLRARGFRGRYRGEDVLGAMIARAPTGDPAAELVVADAFGPGPEAEAVVCSGALNTVVTADHDAEVAAALSALWSRAGAILAVDLAVHDRHPAGVGLARADLAKAWTHARTLAPVVIVREDVVPGEALLVLSKSRATAFARWLPEPLARAGLLIAAGEPAQAEALVADLAAGDAPEVWLVRGRAAAAAGRLADAEAAFARARPLPAASLELAPILWRTGRKGQAEAVLRELARGSDAAADDARAHLALMLAGAARAPRGRRSPERSGTRGSAARSRRTCWPRRARRTRLWARCFDGPAHRRHGPIRGGRRLRRPLRGARRRLGAPRLHRAPRPVARPGLRRHPPAPLQRRPRRGPRGGRAGRGHDLKTAFAGLPAGGAKGVVLDPADARDTAPMYLALGRAIEALDGAFFAGPDVGTSEIELVTLRQATRFVVGPEAHPSQATAHGVIAGCKAALEHLGLLGPDGLTAKVRAAVIGVGSVGSEVARRLAALGVDLVVSDIDEAKVARVAAELGATVAGAHDFPEADLLVPCALGPVVTADNVGGFRYRVICGAANHQLDTTTLAHDLAAQDVLYVPDFTVNAGAVIEGVIRRTAAPGEDVGPAIDAALAQIGPRVSRMLALAVEADVSPLEAALMMIDEPAT
ncbi:MAG: class I SAM-dependent methyltransferase [Myxococcota bacterium]